MLTSLKSMGKEKTLEATLIDFTPNEDKKHSNNIEIVFIEK